jgi:hypothetical protein
MAEMRRRLTIQKTPEVDNTIPKKLANLSLGSLHQVAVSLHCIAGLSATSRTLFWPRDSSVTVGRLGIATARTISHQSTPSAQHAQSGSRAGNRRAAGLRAARGVGRRGVVGARMSPSFTAKRGHHNYVVPLFRGRVDMARCPASRTVGEGGPRAVAGLLGHAQEWRGARAQELHRHRCGEVRAERTGIRATRFVGIGVPAGLLVWDAGCVPSLADQHSWHGMHVGLCVCVWHTGLVQLYSRTVWLADGLSAAWSGPAEMSFRSQRTWSAEITDHGITIPVPSLWSKLHRGICHSTNFLADFSVCV